MKRTTGTDRSITAKWRPATRAVRGGTWRSEHGETSEALFLTSGYTYDSAGEVAARFAGEAEGMTYSRLQNPTVAMLEERLALMEGAEACRAQATGMAAMTTALLCQLSAGDHVVAARAAFGSCRWLVDNLLPRFGIEGTVMLRILVGTDGTPLQVDIERSSGSRGLDRAAREHVLKKWRFQPAMQDGVPVQAWGRVPIVFTLGRA